MEQEEMTRQEQHDIVYRRCICEYGTQPQIDMCIEEMSELTKALLKYRRKFALVRGENVNPTNGDTDLFKARTDIIDELADVRICADRWSYSSKQKMRLRGELISR